MATATVSAAVFLFFFFPIVAGAQNLTFAFHGFNESSLIRQGASIVKPSRALRLTNKTHDIIGHAFYPKPVKMFGNRSLDPHPFNFSTCFVFVINRPKSRDGGYGFAFALTPSPELPGAEAGHYLGLVNSANDGNKTNHIVAVEFDTVNGHNEASDSQGNHVGININGVTSDGQDTAGYFRNDANKEDLNLENGNPIRVWIEYDGLNGQMNVTIAPLDKEKPIKPLLSRGIDLTSILKDTMYVGFSASTGKDKASSHYISGWSFAINGVAPPLNSSLLPVVPKDGDSRPFNPQTKALIASLCFIALLLGAFFLWIAYKNFGQSETLEDWELECPHRFRYKDLRDATHGFKDSQIIGTGGFGAVYKGVLHGGTTEVAVKKITRNSIQGMREFAAEIESLGRLRHKNLVNLQGWCKQKNDLLLVYDYIPNGSLDSLIFNRRSNIVLSWQQRFNIIQGIAAGLLYLHEEWEQVVIHRDVKSSNVLIDADMSARLGDFGLARLYDHGQISHTTNVVGTIGYIAPELARTGKSSASSDVFAYGVLLLEIASGRRPIDSINFILVDWVIELHQSGRIFDAVDPNLNSDYGIEEMGLVLELGLLCSHHRQESRPTMRQVIRYLNKEEQVPVNYNWGSIDSRATQEMNSRYLEVISSDTTYHSSSIGGFSSCSIESGR